MRYIQKNHNCLFCNHIDAWLFRRERSTRTGQEGKQNTVRVGWYQSDMFQEGISDEQVKRGYCYDYLQKVSDMLSEEYDLGAVVE